MFKKLTDQAWNMLPDYAAVSLAHWRHVGKLPSLRHPRTFNEKVGWRKLYQRDPRFPTFCDKIAVKAEIAKLLGEQYIIPSLWTGTEPEAIPFDALTPPYVIKVNHSSGKNIFIRTAADIHRGEIIASLRRQLAFQHGYAYREWGYWAVPHRILVERMIEVRGGDFEELKFFCYHGRTHFIMFGRNPAGGRLRNFYDREWNLLPVTLGFPQIAEAVARPAYLEQILQVAEKIGALFDFVRVDLYPPPQGILFGETTLYPSAGLTPFVPKHWDLIFGEPWKI